MFRRGWFYGNRLKSDRGFVVDILLIGGIVDYRRGRQRVRLSAGTHPASGIVHLLLSDRAVWEPSGRPVQPQERVEILKDVREALEFDGRKVAPDGGQNDYGACNV